MTEGFQKQNLNLHNTLKNKFGHSITATYTYLTYQSPLIHE